MADEQDLLDVEQPQVSPPLPAPRFNQDINLGPTISDLPNPVYQPTEQEARFRNLTDTLRNIPIRSVSEAMNAINLASQLEGRLGLDADLKAGRPPQEAIARWAPKLFLNNPRQLLAATAKQFQPTTQQIGGRNLIQTSPNRFQVLPQDLPTGPITPREIMSKEGELLGYDVTGAKHVVKPSTLKEGATIREQIMLNNARLRAIEKQMEAPGIIQNKARQAELVKQYDEISNELSQLGKKKPSNPISLDSGGIPTVASKEEYDALPSGAVYLNEKSNRKHQKP